MPDPDGGFYSTQDADSEREEGEFFLWTTDEIRAILGDEAEAFLAAYAITPGSNFEAPVPGGLGGKKILELVGC